MEFKVDALPGKKFDGKVVRQGRFPARLNASMIQNVVTYTVVVSADNPDRLLFPYMTANLDFKLGVKLDALLVPNAALRWQPSKKQLSAEAQKIYTQIQREKRLAEADGKERGIAWVTEEEGEIRPLLLTLGASDGVNTEVLAGKLTEKMHVIVGDVCSTQVSGDAGNPFAPKMFQGPKKQE